MAVVVRVFTDRSKDRVSVRLPSSIGAPQTTSSVDAGTPAFTSAGFEMGDALGNLGPEWTFVRQETYPQKMALALSGVQVTRDSLAHLLHTSSSMEIIELKITDADALEESLKQKTVVQKTVAGRRGYVIPDLSLTGGSAFTLIGTSTVLMLEYAVEPFQNFLNWPEELPEAIQSYIGVVRVY